jgi:pyruvate dehydrogenase E2 component (dihydrolipoamide acetyltransferase)
MMTIEIRMPRLGWTMEEGAFGEWLKADGDAIQPGDLLYTVEGDKATQEVEALDAGILRIDPAGPRGGDMVTVGTLLAYLTKPGEPVTFAPSTQSTAAPTIAAQSPIANPQSPIPNPQSPVATTPAISPRARRVAGELGVDWSHLTGSGRTGRIVERDIRAAAAVQEATPAIRATPVAIRMAQEVGVDLAALAAQKPGQRIGREDVEAALAAQSAAATPTQPQSVPPVASGAERLPVSRVRRLIAQRMRESAQSTAAVTLTTEADATELVALRSQLKATFAGRDRPVPTYNDLLIKLTAVALADHPLLRAVWGEEELLIEPGIHIGLAVDTAEGLLVPVVRDVQTQSIRQIAAATRSLIGQAQRRQLSPDALQGGNFTITNLGMYNIDAFTPLINLPQCAILGVGRIVEKPAVHNGQIVPRQRVALSLTFDHRVVDGAPAARFLDTVRGYIEQPLLWLVG